MIPRVVDFKLEGGYRIWLKFSDGVSGQIDIEPDLWGEMFEPLRDQQLFESLKLDQELGTLVWPNGADLAPEYLYQKLCPDYRLKSSQTDAA